MRGNNLQQETFTGFIRGILRGVRYAKSLRVLFLHRRSPSWTTLVLYSRVVFICPGYRRSLQVTKEDIQHFKTDPDPDPLARLNTDPIRIRIRTPGFK
jgi:hypothetical protein